MDKNKINRKSIMTIQDTAQPKQTLKDAKKLDSSIDIDAVKKWREENIEQKKLLRCYTSFVASRPFQEFQVDLFLMDSSKFNVAMLIVDIFTKYTVAIP